MMRISESLIRRENSSRHKSVILSMTKFPDDVQAALATMKVATSEAWPHRAMRARYAAFYFWIFAVGSWLGSISVVMFGLDGGNSEIWKNTITALSVFCGFMIATMLFSGKIDVAKSLTLEQLRHVAAKSNHLLVSQMATLACHFMSLASVSIVTGFHEISPALSGYAIPVAFGFLAVSIIRAMLIPVQIIEIHRFVHAALLEEKRREISKELDLFK